MLLKVLMVALGGGLGASLRFGITASAQRWLGSGFPWGTFAVNAIGCLAFGYLWGLGEQRIAYSSELRLFVFTGILGGLTTFSSYTFESVLLAQDGRMLAAAFNVIGQNVVCAAVFVAGLAFARAS